MDEDNVGNAPNTDRPPVPATLYGRAKWNEQKNQWEAIDVVTSDPSMDVSWMQVSLPGYELEEAMALSVAGLHSSDDQLSTIAKKLALDHLMEWLEDSVNHQRAKRLLFARRTMMGVWGPDVLRNREVEGSPFDQW